MSCRSAANRSRSSLTAGSASSRRASSGRRTVSQAHSGPSVTQAVKATSPAGNSAAYANIPSPSTRLTTPPGSSARTTAPAISGRLRRGGRYVATIATTSAGATGHSP